MFKGVNRFFFDIRIGYTPNIKRRSVK